MDWRTHWAKHTDCSRPLINFWNVWTVFEIESTCINRGASLLVSRRPHRINYGQLLFALPLLNHYQFVLRLIDMFCCILDGAASERLLPFLNCLDAVSVVLDAAAHSHFNFKHVQFFIDPLEPLAVSALFRINDWHRTKLNRQHTLSLHRLLEGFSILGWVLVVFVFNYLGSGC